MKKEKFLQQPDVYLNSQSLMESFHDIIYCFLFWNLNEKENKKLGTICFVLRVPEKNKVLWNDSIKKVLEGMLGKELFILLSVESP